MPNIETTWSLETGFQQALDIDIQLNQIRNTFLEKVSELKEICEYFHTKIFISVTIRVQNFEFPSLHLGKEILSFLNDINAELDIDVYIND